MGNEAVETGADYWKEVGPIMKEFNRKCAQKRMNRAQRIKPELQKICNELGIVGEVKNKGLHWQFRKGDVVLNFFPTTNKITFQGSKSQGRSGNSLPGGVLFTFNLGAYRHRAPIITVALKELGGIRFVMGKNGEPPREMPRALERGSLHFAGFEKLQG